MCTYQLQTRPILRFRLLHTLAHDCLVSSDTPLDQLLVDPVTSLSPWCVCVCVLLIIQKKTNTIWCVCVYCVHAHACVYVYVCKYVIQVVNKQEKCVLTCSGLSSLLKVPRIISPSLPPLLGLAKINKGLQWQLLGGGDMDLITSLYVWVCGCQSVSKVTVLSKGGPERAGKLPPSKNSWTIFLANEKNKKLGESPCNYNYFVYITVLV